MDSIWKKIEHKETILILGFGREGQSTYSFIRSYDTGRVLTIADASESVRTHSLCVNDPHVRYITGRTYMSELGTYDCVIKSPGISLSDATLLELSGRLTSQAALFLEAFRDQTIGITGTKGKSTTSTFVHAALRASGLDAILLGNIGVPPFEVLSRITPETHIVFELSSHMLQTATVSPHIALILNIFPEHLDYYETMERYVASKANIFRFQKEDDVLVFDTNSAVLTALDTFGTQARTVSWNTLSDSRHLFVPREEGKTLSIFDGSTETTFYDPSVKTPINGQHVLRGLTLAAVAACYAGADIVSATTALGTFQGLPHRLENVGTWRGVTFINDSISTIPESALAALAAFPDTRVLILGGMDRGISYDALTHLIRSRPELCVLCIDETGERIYAELMPYQGETKRYFLLDSLEQAVQKSYELLPDGGTVLLSPAAASYTQFKNFEERGKAFRDYALKYGVY
jgi:UDP-N-acetylmuramoylalanine--D-glutamate ligase